jgi:hypothetical protein
VGNAMLQHFIFKGKDDDSIVSGVLRDHSVYEVKIPPLAAKDWQVCGLVSDCAARMGTIGFLFRASGAYLVSANNRFLTRPLAAFGMTSCRDGYWARIGSERKSKFRPSRGEGRERRRRLRLKPNSSAPPTRP